MHVNFGIFPPLPEHVRNKAARRAALVERGARELDSYLSSRPELLVRPLEGFEL